MRVFLLAVLLVWVSQFLHSRTDVIEVDFLKDLDLKVNGAGPLLIKTDPERNRVLLVNTITSSVSVIDSDTHRVKNIPIQGRIPQYLKDEAFALDPRSGNGYIIGNKNIHVLFTEKKKSVSLRTSYQFDTVAVDEHTGNALLAGRETRKIGFLNLKKGTVTYTRCFSNKEVMKNLNQTPPPPIRKIVYDREQRTFFALDGLSSRLFTVSAGTGAVVDSRKLQTRGGSRWHLAGYDSVNHHLYVVIETVKRKVVQALKIDTKNANDVRIDLPELTEGVGISCNLRRDDIYIPYDNHPILHVVNFKNGGSVSEVTLPAYGNDASAVDEEADKLYISSWAYGEIDVIDLKTQKLVKRVRNLGILPHMFSMAIHKKNKKLYIPLGATAVNGSYGSSVTVLDTATFTKEKIITGWAPAAIIRPRSLDRCLVFNSEDEFAAVSSAGHAVRFKLPVKYPGTVIHGKKDNLYLSYGPHQSYWPAVYIWAAENGILEIEPKKLEIPGDSDINYQFFNRRIPRLAHGMVTDNTGSLYCLQNSWGKETLFLSYFKDGIRLFSPQERLVSDLEITRETGPRIIRYDPPANKIYVAVCGEENKSPGKLLIFNPGSQSFERQFTVGICPTDLVSDDREIYVSNFDSDSVTVIDKNMQLIRSVRTGRKPLRLIRRGDKIFTLNHLGNSITEISDTPGTHRIPFKGQPDNMITTAQQIFITSHTRNTLKVFSFHPLKKTFRLLLEKEYPYGDTSFDTANSAFFMRGQFGDALFSITQMFTDKSGKLWITDFLSGKLYILTLSHHCSQTASDCSYPATLPVP